MSTSLCRALRCPLRRKPHSKGTPGARQPTSGSRTAAWLAILALLAAPAAADEPKVFHFDWKLSGFLGFLARPFLPSHGDAVLSTRLPSPERRSHRFHVTAPQENDDDYWTYGSETELSTGQPLRVWSDYHFRGRSKHREKPVEDAEVVELASLIDRIRRLPPERPAPLRLWWDGEIYAAVVLPRGTAPVPREGGEARLYEVRGDRARGSDLKGRLRIWLHPTEPIPLHLDFSRAAMRVRFHLRETPALVSPPSL